MAIDDGKDTEDKMEEALVGFLSSLNRPAHLGKDVGRFLIERFGQSCRVGFGLGSLLVWCNMASTANKPSNLCHVQGELGPFIKARQHLFSRDDMYISLVGSRSQRQAGPHVAQREAVDAPPGFADRPAPSQSHAQKGGFF